MLYPITTEKRTIIDLNGPWKFLLDNSKEKVNVLNPLPTNEEIIVPGSYNDQIVSDKVRYHVGDVWYEREFVIPDILNTERLMLRIGSATHHAVVYINGREIISHKGGFTPFEAEINQFLIPKKNRLTIKVNNILDYSTLPVGIYNEYIDEDSGVIKKENNPNFDFFNYAGLNRPIKIYSTPKTYIEDIILTYSLKENAYINTNVKIKGNFDYIKLIVLNMSGEKVSESKDCSEVIIKNYHRWEPLNAYLYTIRVELFANDELIDIYEEPLGLRTVEVKKGKFLINNKPFYFKGFGKHEDTYSRGRGLDEVTNKRDMSLFEWIGANSFRTSHYPYSEEMMRMADREGIVVINEVPAVGLYVGFNVSLVPKKDIGQTWNILETKEAHVQALTELINRDKNHACVVLWSIANESATHESGAVEYYKPLIDLVKQKDPQKRPITMVFIQESSPENDLVSDYLDVICLNRYYGWYIDLGNLEKSEYKLKEELKKWGKRHPNKPIIFTEYGADTIPGYHSITTQPFTEEYQVKYYEMYHKVFDEFDIVVGEQVWNFADFETDFSTKRVQGNKKGIFTRAREPKLVAHELKKRWQSIPEFFYK